MSSKAQSVCRSIATRNTKNTLGSQKQPPTTSETPSEGVVLTDNCSTLIEVTVKTNGRKRTSTMVSKSPTNHKADEQKRRPGISGDSQQNWGRILREHNLATMKQSTQQLVRAKGSKSAKQGSETKDTKKHVPARQKLELNYKNLDAIPVKQTSQQRRAEEHMKLMPRLTNPSSTSVASSMDSILVLDRAVQCGGVFDCPDNRLVAFNPVRMLGFLMKELEHLVKDDKASKILSDMEQVLIRIPEEPHKSTSAHCLQQDLESIALRRKLEASTIQLEETSRKMNKMCEALREERDSLQLQVHKQVLLLNEAQVKQLELEATLKALKQKLEETEKMKQSRERTISELKEDSRGYEFSQKVIADLRANLSEQTELARQRHLEVQYLTLEKDKLSVLSSYKDTLLIELRKAVKELQNYIAEQLTDLKVVHVHEQNSNPQVSLVRGGRACSSPTSTSSRESNVPSSWQDISDVSLSAVEYNPREDGDEPTLLQDAVKPVPFSANACENLEKKRTKSGKDRNARDSAQLEFISLPGGESSHTLLLPTYRDYDCTDSSQLVTNEKGEGLLVSNKKNEGAYQFKGADAKTSSFKFPRQAFDKKNDDGMRVKNPSRDEYYLESNKDNILEKQKTPVEAGDVCKISGKNLSDNMIASAITEQFQNIFQDMRHQSRIPVNVPSPPRDYPHPNWTDSTLPSISTASESNVTRSNDT